VEGLTNMQRTLSKPLRAARQVFLDMADAARPPAVRPGRPGDRRALTFKP
jgi:hypothetical protein